MASLSAAETAKKYGAMKKNPRLAAARSSTVRLNSTSTLYVSETLSQPNNKTTIRSVAEAFICRLRDSILKVKDQKAQAAQAEKDTGKDSASLTPSDTAAIGGCVDTTWTVSLATAGYTASRGAQSLPESSRLSSDPSIFDENPETCPPPVAPTPGQVEYVIRHIFKTGQLSVDCNIIALVYIDRLLATGMPLTVRNWRTVLAISMILASKVWDDLSMINEDFSTFLPFTLSELNKWEVKYLNALSFNVRVKASEYARYYFDLRNSIKTGTATGISVGDKRHNSAETGRNGIMQVDAAAAPVRTPIDTKAAHKLEALSASAQARFEALYGAVPDSSGSIHNLAKIKVPRIERSVSDLSKASGGAIKKSVGRSVLS